MLQLLDPILGGRMCEHPAHKLKLIDISLDRDFITIDESYYGTFIGGELTTFVEVECIECGERFTITRTG